MQRVGVTDVLASEINIYYQPIEQLQPRPPAIVIIPCCETAWDDLLALPPNSISTLEASTVLPPDASLPWDEPTPVPFWGCGYGNRQFPFAERYQDGIVVFYADIIATTLFMLSRWEETVLPDRDQHGRFPAASSVAYKQGFLDRPIVDEYALILRTWLQTILPDLELKPQTFSVKLSHDIDYIRSYLTYKKVIRSLRNALLKKRDLLQFLQVLKNVVWQVSYPSKSPYYQRIRWLAQMSQQHNLESVFNFITADPTPMNRQKYDLSSRLMQQCLRDLRELGAEIGLHAGYDTFNDPDKLKQEKTRLEKFLGSQKKASGGRQHYLRFQVPETWRYWEQADLSYDSTMSYAAYEGFRCGTCHPFRPFDIELDRTLDLMELPLIIMDQTLRNYRMMTPEQGERRIIELAQKCKQVEGIFTMLWHNTSLDGEWEPWLPVYERVLYVLEAMQV